MRLCESYASYLRENGFTVTVKPTHELAQMSRMAGIPENFEGCHLSMIDGYVVSGHVPVASVERLLSEQPKIVGITLPGMPQGSPGMSGRKTEPFTTYEIGSQSPRILCCRMMPMPPSMIGTGHGVSPLSLRWPASR